MQRSPNRLPSQSRSGEDGAGNNAADPGGGGNGGSSVSFATAGQDQSSANTKPSGALQSYDEKFDHNAITGTSGLTIPIASPAPSRADGLEPGLALSYNSGSANGAFGIGWSLNLGDISRVSADGSGIPTYEEEKDVFSLTGSDYLVPLSSEVRDGYTVTKYHPRVMSGNTAKIEKFQSKTDPDNCYWRVIGGDNVTTLYGCDKTSRIASGKTGEIYSWLPSRRYDSHGNAIYYYHKDEDETNVDFTLASEVNRGALTNKYLSSVRYCNTIPYASSSWDITGNGEKQWLYEIKFDYGDDADRKWKCREDPFSSYHSGFEIRMYRRCEGVNIYGPGWIAKEKNRDGLLRSYKLNYENSHGVSVIDSITSTTYSVDSNGNASSCTLPPFTFTYSQAPPPLELKCKTTDQPLTDSVDSDSGTSYSFLDIEGEGLPSLVKADLKGLYRRRNLTLSDSDSESSVPTFGDWELLDPTPSTGSTFADVDGDSKLERVEWSEGFYHHDEKSGKWDGFEAFESNANVDLKDSNCKFLDLTGNGLADIVFFNGDEHIVWYKSLGKKGHGPAEYTPIEETGPRALFWDGKESLYLADMSGDGSSDLVRILHNEICYWPNMGYGRFGKKLVLSNNPFLDASDQFAQGRVFLADVDGSGTTDLLYLPRSGGINLYKNYGGSRWSDVFHISSFPDIDTISSVTVADLFGNGTTCLIWSRPDARLSYIDLVGGSGVKPNLLTGYNNGLGSETKLEYTSSSRLYLEDRLNGEPWVYRLANPVHCLTKTIQIDTVVKDFPPIVSRFRYRHGYFDGIEREFRGFAMVESWDTDEGVPNGSHTKTWYHLGSVTAAEAEFKDDYTNKSNILASVMPDALGSYSIDESYRALKGSLLHRETFSSDGRLLAVSDNSYNVKLVVPGTETKKAVFQLHGRENLFSDIASTSVSAGKEEPRVTKSLTVEVDDYGSVLKSAKVAQGRTGGDAAQKKTWVMYEEHSFTNAVDNESSFRIPMNSTSVSYDIEYDGNGSIEDAIEKGKSLRSTVASSRTIYLSDNLEPLPQGKVDSLGLVDRTYSLVFTPDILSNYKPAVATADLTEMGYVNLDGDGCWWAFSSRSLPYDPSDDPSGRVEKAKSGFYMAEVVLDQWDNKNTVGYDDYRVLAVTHTDALGNVTSGSYDYFLGKESSAVDKNGNVTEFGFGYNTSGNWNRRAFVPAGDSLSSPTTNAPPQAGEDIKTWAASFLGNATEASIVDYSSLPVREISVKRETFTKDLQGDQKSRLQISIAYYDGRGRALQTKTTAADGKWLASPWIEYDRRGNPIKQYEPFLSTTHELEARKDGVYSASFYDSLKKRAGDIFPDGTWTKTVFGIWKQLEYDRGDTVLLDPKQDEDIGAQVPADIPKYTPDEKSKAYANTPTTNHMDALGRTYKVVKDNGNSQLFETSSVINATGQVESIVDSLGRAALKNVYDLTGNVIYSSSIDSGESWKLYDANGQEGLRWSGKETVGKTRKKFDELRRPVEEYLEEKLVVRMFYGESKDSLVPEQPQSRGRLVRIQDQAGSLSYAEYDFRGLLMKSERKMTSSFKVAVDWKGEVKLDDRVWTISKTYDALGREISETSDNGVTTYSEFNEEGAVRSIYADMSKFNSAVKIKDMEYNAKGQITKALLENGCTTTYTYDDKMFYLQRKLTLNSKNKALQDLTYSYDALGNITSVTDAADQSVYFRGSVAKPVWDFTYDAVNRLVQATGREDLGDNPGTSMANYTETYTYDSEGNFKTVQHASSDAQTQNWKRVYDYFPDSNRLRSFTNSGEGSTDIGYDVLGLPGNMGKLKNLSWDYKNRLFSSSPQVDGESGNTLSTYYKYDWEGKRIRKVAEIGGDRVKETVYIGDNFESYRKDSSEGWDKAVQILNIISSQRVATIEFAPDEDPLVSYLVADGQGLVTVELGPEAEVVSREEYTPYGDLSHATGATRGEGPKRYRFAHRDRDSESGLYYSMQRYLIPGVGRWLSPDPIGVEGGLNLYCYVMCNPISYSDATGLQPTPAPGEPGGATQRRTLVSTHLAYLESRPAVPGPGTNLELLSTHGTRQQQAEAGAAFAADPNHGNLTWEVVFEDPEMMDRFLDAIPNVDTTLSLPTGQDTARMWRNAMGDWLKQLRDISLFSPTAEKYEMAIISQSNMHRSEDTPGNWNRNHLQVTWYGRTANPTSTTYGIWKKGALKPGTQLSMAGWSESPDHIEWITHGGGLFLREHPVYRVLLAQTVTQLMDDSYYLHNFAGATKVIDYFGATGIAPGQAAVDPSDPTSRRTFPLFKGRLQPPATGAPALPAGAPPYKIPSDPTRPTTHPAKYDPSHYRKTNKQRELSYWGYVP